MKIKSLNNNGIKHNLSLFENGSFSKDEGHNPTARYASFDYCFNYFQGFKNKKDIANEKNIQNSCLHLAFYLASWGMLRGSSFLLQKSIKFYEPLIKYISETDKAFWEIDVNNYKENNNIEKLLQCYKDINERLDSRASDILITKIMLGVFGNVPAFDTYFKQGSGLNTFNKESLEQIFNFYKNNESIIYNESNNIKTFIFLDDEDINRNYTKAKIIDMIFFIEGFNKK